MTHPESTSGSPSCFELKDCALIAIATGRKVLTLREFRDALLSIKLDSIYYHFWGGLLHPRFEEREYNNDFASWAWRGLHDPPLAERLALIDPTEYADLARLRDRIVELIEDRLDESESLRWRVATRQFEFICSQIVVFDTGKRLEHPEQMKDAVPALSTGSVFYHFIDSRRRLPGGMDDFREWLRSWDETYARLCALLAEVDPYYNSLSDLRRQLAEVVTRFFGGADFS